MDGKKIEEDRSEPRRKEGRKKGEEGKEEKRCEGMGIKEA